MATVEHSLRTLLEEQTASGRLVPGSRLPTERALVEQLAAPRSAIRRALAELEVEGLIVRHVGRGTFLSESAHARSDAPPDTSPAEVMGVRMLFEPPIAGLAARLATGADIAAIQERLADGARAIEFDTFERTDARLHRSIAVAAHNTLLMSMFEVMNTARALPVWGSLKHRTSTPERRARYHDEHAAVVAALADRDPAGAEAAMHAHLQHVADDLLGRNG